MVVWLYRIVLVLALPLVWLRLRWRARREPEYGERVAERFGRVPKHVRPGCVWFHTVSAGETIAAVPLIRKLAGAFDGQPFLVTTMTPTGSAQVQQRLSDMVDHCYAPYDFAFAVRRFFERVQPAMLVLMETELWPNLIAEAHRRGIPIYLVNARLSERSARGYARAGSLTRNMLLRLTAIACQSEAHAERFIALGASPGAVRAMGSVKYDVTLPEDFIARSTALRAGFGFAEVPTWIAASTHPGEDEQILKAHAAVRDRLPDACLLLVPRHPVRADEVAALVEQAGLSWVRHSAIDPAAPAPGRPIADVVIGDLMGTLQALYGCADVAFVGGSLVAHGGHNPLEPAACAIPVLSGPHQFNFTQIMDELRARGGLETVSDAAALGERVGVLLADPAARQRIGCAAEAALSENRGTTDQLVQMLSRSIRSIAQ